MEKVHLLVCFLVFHPLTDDKILGLPKLKAFADDKSNMLFHGIENMVHQKLSLCGNGLSATTGTLQHLTKGHLGIKEEQ